MTCATQAGQLVTAFGVPDEMAKLYAPEIKWNLPPSLPYAHPIVGRDAVVAYNRHVWDDVYFPDCLVEILDELGGIDVSAVRFIYRATHRAFGVQMEGEYTLFAKAGPTGISEVNEGLDTLGMFDFLADKPLGSTFRRLREELGNWKRMP